MDVAHDRGDVAPAPRPELLAGRHERHGSIPADGYETVDQLIDQAREPRVTLIGVSFGGLIAVRYAARHPDRIGALILVASPSPLFELDRISAACARYPRVALPLFALRGCLRVAPEILAARDHWPSRMKLAFNTRAAR